MEDWFLQLSPFQDKSMEHIYEEAHSVEQSFDKTCISDVRFDPHLMVAKRSPVDSYYLDF